jgi:competence protein ComEC
MSSSSTASLAQAHLPPWLRVLSARRLALAVAEGAAAERGRLAPWLAVALGAGVAAYFALSFEPDPAWRWGAVPPLLLALALARRAPLLAWVAGLAAAAAIGAAVASWHTARVPPMPDLPRGAVLVSGIVERVDLLPEGRRLTLATPRLGEAAPETVPPLERRLRVRLRANDPARPEPGDRVTVRALVRSPAPPAYPGAWDFQRASWFSGLAGSGFAIGPAEVTTGAAEPSPFARLRTEIEARVTAQLPGPAGAVAAALLTGGQSAIPETDLAALRDSGLAHILSVSGLHVAIVMGLTFGLLRLALAAAPPLALRLPVKAVAALAALAAGGFYLLLTGGQVPMQRSLAMAALATLALLAGRRALTVRAWALAFALVLLIEPVAVLGPSFQMSFAAVLALIAGWEWLRPRVNAVAPRPGGAVPAWDGWRRRLLLGAFGLCATSVLAGAATTPFGLHHFGRLQVYGVAANALAVPITSFLVMPAGMAAAALMPLGLEGLALAPMGWGVEAILRVAHWVAGWPGAAVAARPIPAWGLALVALGMAWLCLWRGALGRALGLVPLLVGLASGATEAARPPDALVSSDARLILLRPGEGAAPVLQRQTGASALVREQWLRWLGASEVQPLPAGAGEAGAGSIRCTPAICLFRPARAEEAGTLALLRGEPSASATAAACGRGGVAVLVSAEPVRGAASRCAGPVAVVDRFAVWRNGAHAIWLDGAGARVLSDRAARGDRPWVPPPPRPRGGGAPAEPPAATE